MQKLGTGKVKIGLGMHGIGLGDDGPVILPWADAESRLDDVPLRPNTTFEVKALMTYDGKPNVARIGESIVVGERSAERLGHLPLTEYWHTH
jgi:hypothetical protein